MEMKYQQQILVILHKELSSNYHFFLLHSTDGPGSATVTSAGGGIGWERKNRVRGVLGERQERELHAQAHCRLQHQVRRHWRYSVRHLGW